MRRRDTRSLRAASGDGECLTFDFILNSYTRYRATQTRVSLRIAGGGEEDKSLIGNKSISVLARENWTRYPPYIITRERLLFNAG